MVANLFVVFGEPYIELRGEDGMHIVELYGVDIFKPATGNVVACDPDDIAYCSSTPIITRNRFSFPTCIFGGLRCLTSS